VPKISDQEFSGRVQCLLILEFCIIGFVEDVLGVVCKFLKPVEKAATTLGEAGWLGFRALLRSAAVEDPISATWMQFVWRWSIDKFVLKLTTQADHNSICFAAAIPAARSEFFLNSPLVYPCGQTERSQLFAYFRGNAEGVPPEPGLSSGSYMTVIQDAPLAQRSRKQAYFEHP
jgi:hypothetical protein